MTDFYSQNRCVCSTRSHGPLLCAFCLSFHFKVLSVFQLGALSEGAAPRAHWLAPCPIYMRPARIHKYNCVFLCVFRQPM